MLTSPYWVFNQVNSANVSTCNSLYSIQEDSQVQMFCVCTGWGTSGVKLSPLGRWLNASTQQSPLNIKISWETWMGLYDCTPVWTCGFHHKNKMQDLVDLWLDLEGLLLCSAEDWSIHVESVVLPSLLLVMKPEADYVITAGDHLSQSWISWTG